MPSPTPRLAWTWRKKLLDSNLPSTTRLVLLVLHTYMDADGNRCFPATKTLAEKANLSERSVCTHLQSAEKAGWIKRRRRRSGQGWRRHEYTPTIPTRPRGDLSLTESASTAGTEPHHEEALSPVQSKYPRDLPKNPSPDPLPPASPAGATRLTRSRTSFPRTPLPEDFVLTDDLREHARAMGFEDPDPLLPLFRRDVRGSSSKNWPDRFCRWLRGQRQENKEGHSRRPRGSRIEAQASPSPSPGKVRWNRIREAMCSGTDMNDADPTTLAGFGGLPAGLNDIGSLRDYLFDASVEEHEKRRRVISMAERFINAANQADNERSSP